jgi:hypothetical protein
MIIADRKSLEEIQDMIKDIRKFFLVGCKGCVTVCNVGGLPRRSRSWPPPCALPARKRATPSKIDEVMLERQCDPEYVEQLRDSFDQYDAVLSMACGVGPQFLVRSLSQPAVFSGGEHSLLGRCGSARHLGGALRRLRYMRDPLLRRPVPHCPLFQEPAARTLRRQRQRQM